MKALLILVTCCAAVAQTNPNRLTAPFSDPNRPRHVAGTLTNGCFTVEGYEGTEVVIEERAVASREHGGTQLPRGAEGLKRIDPTGMSLTVEEENNTVTIRSHSMRGGDLLVRVPFATSLKLKCMNGGDIKVDRVTGDLELQNLNGAVTATNVSGSVIAHSLNGQVLVTLEKVTAGKPMSFTSLNGNVDVTLPPGASGAVRAKSDNGAVYSDFDIKLNPAAAPVVEDGRSKGSKYRVKVDGTTTGTLNGGGPDLTFTTFNGNIYIRKKK